MSSPTAAHPTAFPVPVGDSTSARPEHVTSETAPAVKIWASIGVSLLAIESFFLLKWVTGPRFTPVESGPDSTPGWMGTIFLIVQLGLIVAFVATMYHFVVKPWRRERRVTTDGLLCIAFLTVSPWDPLSNWFGNWFTYNSELWNFGSVVGELPGGSGRYAPGVGEAWGIVFIPTVYVTIFIWMAMLVCWMMRSVKRRFPQLGTFRMIAVCFAITMLADVIIEGVFFVRLGFYNFAGGHFAINGDTYYKFPLQEMVWGGAVFAMFCCVRYFTNDKGETIAERGSDRLQTTTGRKNALRGLALIGVVHVGFLVCYHIPSGVFALNSTEWPKDVENRSYMTNGVCGPVVDRACPGPNVPGHKDGAGYLDYSGNWVPEPKS